MMPQSMKLTTSQSPHADRVAQPRADAVLPRTATVAHHARALAPLRQPPLISGLRVPGDRIARGRQRRHVFSDDEDKAFDAALDALARDLGVELED